MPSTVTATERAGVELLVVVTGVCAVVQVVSPVTQSELVQVVSPATQSELAVVAELVAPSCDRLALMVSVVATPTPLSGFNSSSGTRCKVPELSV